MSLPRIRFTPRQMMILLLVVGVACGWLARRLRRQALLAEATAQSVATNGMTSGPPILMWPGAARGEGRMKYLDLSPDRVRWVWMCKLWSDPGDTGIVDVEVLGDCDGGNLEASSIKGHGGAQEARVIEALTRAFREQGWRYEIMPRAGYGPDTRCIA